jgi:hypothetical protein
MLRRKPRPQQNRSPEDVSAMAGSLQKSPPAPFASHPSDAALINSYLRPWVVSGEKVGEFIHAG